MRWADKQTMIWDAQMSATRYHIYGGLVSDLTCSYFGECWDDLDLDPLDTMLTDANIPLSGECWFYLVTTEGPTGIEGASGSSACGTRFHSPSCP